VHNIGHFRFLECSALKAGHQPDGDVVAWDEVYFPFDPTLAEAGHCLEREEIRRSRKAQLVYVEECYECDAEGIITVTIRNQTTGQDRTFRIRQESQQTKGPRSMAATPAAN